MGFRAKYSTNHRKYSPQNRQLSSDSRQESFWFALELAWWLVSLTRQLSSDLYFMMNPTSWLESILSQSKSKYTLDLRKKLFCWSRWIESLQIQEFKIFTLNLTLTWISDWLWTWIESKNVQQKNRLISVSRRCIFLSAQQRWGATNCWMENLNWVKLYIFPAWPPAARSSRHVSWEILSFARNPDPSLETKSLVCEGSGNVLQHCDMWSSSDAVEQPF